MDVAVFGGTAAVLWLAGYGWIIHRTVQNTLHFAEADPRIVDSVPRNDTCAEQLEQWKKQEAILFVGWWLLFAMPLYLIFAALAQATRSLIPEGRFVFTITPWTWVFLALFASPPLAAAANFWFVARRLGRPCFTRWRQAEKQSSPMDPLHMGYTLTVGIGAVSAVLLFLTLNQYVVVQKTGIQITGLFYHSWSEVRSITLIRSHMSRRGRPVRDPYYHLEFRDGSHWTTKHLLLEIHESEAAKMAEYVREHSGQRIQIQDPYPDAPPAREPLKR
ncbi:MAG: hypothetical protein OHK0029_17050 [Armatimonadaceae bacterium]